MFGRAQTVSCCCFIRFFEAESNASFAGSLPSRRWLCQLSPPRASVAISVKDIICLPHLVIHALLSRKREVVPPRTNDMDSVSFFLKKNRTLDYFILRKRVCSCLDDCHQWNQYLLDVVISFIYVIFSGGDFFWKLLFLKVKFKFYFPCSFLVVKPS